MNNFLSRAAVLAVLALSIAVPALAAKTPTPLPTIYFSKVPLHTDFTVEVNKKGQIVQVEKATGSVDRTFNAHTYGNVLQMWIRHPDGTATVGLFKVSYDFNPKTKDIHRSVALIRAGGAWANKIGAADNMTAIAKRSRAQKAPILPSLNAITGAKPSPKP